MLNPTKDCFTAALFGVQFLRPCYSMASFFGEILDTFSFNEEVAFEVSHIDNTSTVFKIDGVRVIINPKNIQVHTNINIAKKVAEITDIDHSHASLTNGWGSPFDSTEIAVVDSVHNLKSQFQIDAQKIFEILGMFFEEVPLKIRFFGYVETYLIPIVQYDWKIMDDFDKGASVIKGAAIHDKIARNRYILAKDENGMATKSLIFQMMRPHNMPKSNCEYAFAHFDNQHWHNGKVGIKDIAWADEVSVLGTELHQLIDNNNILEVEKKRLVLS